MIVILSHLLIQEGQFLAKECTQVLDNHLENYDYQDNVWLGELTALDMTRKLWLELLNPTHWINQLISLGEII